MTALQSKNGFRGFLERKAGREQTNMEELKSYTFYILIFVNLILCSFIQANV
jgi:hypothetical protein